MAEKSTRITENSRDSQQTENDWNRFFKVLAEKMAKFLNSWGIPASWIFHYWTGALGMQIASNKTYVVHIT